VRIPIERQEHHDRPGEKRDEGEADENGSHRRDYRALTGLRLVGSGGG
jgi:hypothetical protein